MTYLESDGIIYLLSNGGDRETEKNFQRNLKKGLTNEKRSAIILKLSRKGKQSQKKV